MSSKKLDYQGRAFSDSDLQELPLKDVAYPYEEVNFSQNQLSAEGLRKVLDLCSRCEHLRVLKLYKNDINDDAAQALGRFVRRCYSLEELHLSHNRFTERGVEMLVKAAQEARDAVDGGAPMWMRLEQNEVSNPDQVLADLQNRYSVCSKKNRTKCSNRHCIYDCKVHLPHFHFQRDEFGQANNEGPRKRKWDNSGTHGGHGGHGHHVETNDSWKESDWREGRDDWFDGRPEVFRKDWEDWQQLEPQERPTTGVKMSGGIFMRAMGAIVQNKDDTEDGRPGETKSRRTAVPNNVASRTLNQLGVLAEPRTKVLLKEAPGGIKDEEEDQDEDDEDKVSEDKDEEEEEMEGEVEEERGRPSRGSPPSAREASRRDRGGRHEANDRRTERRVQEKRRAQQQQQSRRHRDEGGRRDGRDGREHNRRERERRRNAPERSEHRSRSRGRRGHPQRTRSRERRRAQEEKRSQRERERHGRRPRGERREERGERREERAERREERTERAERPRRRDERAAAGERTEKLLEKIQTGREKASTKALATKQEPNDHKAPPVAFVATRAKAAPRRPAAPAAPAYVAATTAPRPKGRAPAPAPKVAAKAAADGNESEYTYTEASEYTYEDVEGEEEEEAVDVEDDESDE